MDTKERIIQGADELYMKFGIKSVSMDDLASQLAISKKTIYQHFSDKDDLVLHVAENRMQVETRDLEEIKTSSKDAIEEIYKVSVYIKEHISKMNPSILFDLRKFHPKAWECYENHKIACMYGTIVENLEQGKKEGFYRESINSEILGMFRMASIEITFDSNFFPSNKFDFYTVQMQIFEHFLMGIITPTGLKLFEKYKKHYEK